MAKVVIGLIMDYPCLFQWNENQKMGARFKNASCGRKGIMIQLRLVKTSREVEDNKFEDNNDTTVNHGTKVLLKLIQPWQISDRVVCTDSYFASVQAPKELLRVGMKFIGVMKTATKEYPLAHVQSIEMEARGDMLRLVSNNAIGIPQFLAFVWLGRDCWYFIATYSSLQEDQPHVFGNDGAS
jgi:Transposase IS4